MSHVTKINTEINDLAALKAACKELNCEWVEGKQTYEWFGRSVGDYPLPEGFTADMLGKCSHVIRVPKESYEIGVVKVGDKYRLLFDSWGIGPGHTNKIVSHLGDKLQKLTQRYAVCKVEAEARKKGMMFSRSFMPNGSIKIQIGVR